jgi:hypothetical protein
VGPALRQLATNCAIELQAGASIDIPSVEQLIGVLVTQTRNCWYSGAQVGLVPNSTTQPELQLVPAAPGHFAAISMQALAQSCCTVCWAPATPGGVSLAAPAGSLPPLVGSIPKGLNVRRAGPAPPPQPETAVAAPSAIRTATRSLMEPPL